MHSYVLGSSLGRGMGMSCHDGLLVERCRCYFDVTVCSAVSGAVVITRQLLFSRRHTNGVKLLILQCW